MYRLDDSRRPLVVFHMRGRLSWEEIQLFMADVDEMVDQVQPSASVYDIDVALPPREQIMKVLSWSRDMRVRFRENYEFAPDAPPTFVAYHMPSTAGKVLRFFLSMLPALTSQIAICSSLPEAIEAAEAALDRFGIDYPKAVSSAVGQPRG